MSATELPMADRLRLVRQELAAQGLGGFIVPRADEHLGEYVAGHAERLRWLTGFSGSAGVAIVLAAEAAVFSDGRYTIQLAAETDPQLFERRHVLEHSPVSWLARHAHGTKVGYDPKLMGEVALEPFLQSGILLVPVERNPVDLAWTDRPAAPSDAVVPHPHAYSGTSSFCKRSDVGRVLSMQGQDVAVISDTASVAWLFNLRGSDAAYNPGVHGFALLMSDGRAELFIEPGKIPAETLSWLGNEVTVSPVHTLEDALGRLGGSRVRVDPANTPTWFIKCLQNAGAVVVRGEDPCLMPKACKNSVEREGAREAHRRDAVAMAKFLCHMAEAGPRGIETEMSAAAKLLSFRAEALEFRTESFQAISSTGPHAAINHYKVTPDSNRRIEPGQLYLVDSGGQYLDGTTDVTRTLWTGHSEPPQQLRDQYTRVLQGLISLDTLVFPLGTAGVHIDAFARRMLWQAGLDYDHGTGHGVGSFLGVHEGPASISRPLRPNTLAPNMLLSNEPGYYVPGQYGMRLENLMLVLEANMPNASTTFLRFDSITLVPFERRLIDDKLLSDQERGWIDSYHRRVEQEIAPRLEGSVRTWLLENCAPL